ncbi:MAG: ABC transporter permease [Caldiserica bacterium]|jgi:putative ABC transport system permease protein|nr:ABC transporter permease [Caldisericota bacterium]MDH7562206.1 ABC transporter permease [Caldisericota bacterium]
MLGRIPLRIINRNRSQFLGIILLVFLASFAYSLFSILVANVDLNYKKFVESSNQETFHFITRDPVDVSSVSSKFRIDLEERYSWDYDFGDRTLRIFNISQKVNKPLISEGSLPAPGEMAIDPNFARENNFKVGDELRIEERNFRISGFVNLPDYIYIIKNDTDFLNDPQHFGIGVMNLSDLEPFLSPSFHYYMGKGDVEDMSSLKAELNSRYTLLSFQEKWDNFRIITTEKKMESARPMAYVISSIILLISSILLFIVLRRLINSMHGEIGTLYALGYNQREISRVYLRFPLITWLVGAIPGGILGLLASGPFINFYVSFLSVPIIDRFLPVFDFLISLFLPLIFMLPSGYLAISSLLKRSVVEIIKGESQKGIKQKIRFRFLDRLSFRRRLMLKQGLLHISRELVLALGVAFATFILLFGVSAAGAIENTVNDTYQNIFRYNYMYLFNTFQERNDSPQAERFTFLPFTLEGTKTKVSLYGIEKNSQMVTVRGPGGQPIQLEGLVVTRSLADKLNLKEGDSLNLVSNLNGRKYSLKVNRVAEMYLGNSGYMNLEEFNRTFGLKDGSFLGLFSPVSLNIPRASLLASMDKEYVIKVFRDSASTIEQMIRVIGLISFFLALVIVFVLSSLTIAENRKPLSIFKILGYRDGELSSILLGFNNISFLAGFLLGIPIYNYMMKILMNQVLRDMDFSLNVKADIQSVLISFLVLLSAFLISKFFSRRRIYSISPSVILKEQME